MICLLAVLVALPAIIMGPLRSSGDSSADAASVAEASPQVRRLYLAAFEREPDAGGFALWVRLRTEGRSLEWVADRFVESAEFRQRYGPGLRNGDFVRLLYSNVLDREPDSGGYAAWTGALRAGAGRGWVLMHFSESPEFQSKTPPATSGPAATTTTTSPPPTTPPPTTAPTTPPPTTPPPPPPPTGGQAGGTSNGGLANVSSGLNPNSFMVPPANPNPENMSNIPAGAFRTFCEFSHVAYADPILQPGNARFSHLHMFFGNTGANQNSTYQSLRTSGDSTCEGGPMNRTAYWMPTVFDGNNNVVVPNNFELYYKGENTKGTLGQRQGQIQAIQPYPNGLRMVAGSQGGSGAGSIWGWACSSSSRSTSTIPECPSGDSLQAWVRFPYCWDGKNLDSADHRSHMSYGTDGTYGTCPASHPIHVPELTEKAHFRSPAGSSGWYLSSDRANMIVPAPNGSTFHADWFGAWEDSVEDRWVNNCIKGYQNASNGSLCDGQALRSAGNYGGPDRIGGYTPAPR